ncbi:DUF3795 domain-containing protein [Desulfolithobacter sp.]
MIAYCGLDCSRCETYRATRDDDEKRRAEIAAKWSVRYRCELTADDINCTGCKGEGIKFSFCGQCPVRACCRDRELDHCARCPDYICEKLQRFIDQAPTVGRALEKLRQQNKNR